MADLYFPQLKTGAIAHYPVRKTLVTRTVSNILPGGGIFTYPDDGASRGIWSWEYVGLTFDEAAVLQKFFDSCDGPLRPFTFLDPVGNLLASNCGFREPEWQSSAAATIFGNLPGPFPSATAVMITNRAQAVQEVWQTLPIPADYTYCFSLYVSSATEGSVTLFRRSSQSESTVSFGTSSEWKRISSSGNLQDSNIGMSVGIRLLPGQQVSVSAAQLEAQPTMSRYRTGLPSGDLYLHAHWALEELQTRYIGPNNCTVSVSIEA